MRFVAAGCLLCVALAACSDTPVSPHALRAQALHFDSLTTAAIQQHPTDATRLSNLYTITNALARGAVPGVVTMTVAGTPVTVHLVGIAVFAAGDTSDEHVSVAGWVDADADTSITVFVIHLTTGNIDQAVALAIGDSSEWTQAYPPQFTFSQQSVSTPCTNYPITNELAGPNPPCHLAAGVVAFNAVPETFQGSPLLLPVGAAIVSPSASFQFVQFLPSNQGL